MEENIAYATRSRCRRAAVVLAEVLVVAIAVVLTVTVAVAITVVHAVTLAVQSPSC